MDFRIATVTNVMKDGISLSASQSSVSNLFTLSNAGQLVSMQPLDKEAVDSYTVVVTAADRGESLAWLLMQQKVPILRSLGWYI